jgi:hypothetical protein
MHERHNSTLKECPNNKKVMPLVKKQEKSFAGSLKNSNFAAV